MPQYRFGRLRSRNFGFPHPNRNNLIALPHIVLKTAPR
jgi:hypothetical protein